MFSWGGGLAVPTVAVDVNKERDPPALPTPLDFPAYIPENVAAPLDSRSCDVLYELLANLKRPQDVSPNVLKALNLRVESDLEPSDIIPGSTSHPPYQWPEAAETPENASSEAPGNEVPPPPKLMNNGAPFPNKDRYDILREELLFVNDDAFRVIARLAPRPGREKVRVAHSRKFWAGLDQVAQYWDTSLDEYIDRQVESQADEEDVQSLDRMHLDNGQDDAHKGANERTCEGKRDIDGELKPKGPTKDPSVEVSNQPCTKRMYKGRRLGTGREMPESMREDMLRGFVEMVAWPFGCQVSIPSLPPRLSVKSLLFPVRQNFTVSRSPQDRQTARKGILEGPLLFVQCRGETAFHDEAGGPNARHAEICDLLRETAGMLLFAQERARQGTTEVKPGDGKWWTTTPRWGGAANPGPVGDELKNGDAPKEAPAKPGASSKPEEPSANKRSKNHASLPFRRPGSGHSKKLSMAEKWKILQPGPSLWDKKMRYMQIGKDPDSPFDDIFMISSINHHFSILHLRVHSHYLEWLATGKTDFPEDLNNSGQQPWHTITLRRTRWFDFLRADDRIAGLDGLWALFTHMMR